MNLPKVERYGDKSLLEEFIGMMQAHGDMIGRISKEEDAWHSSSNSRSYLCICKEIL